MLAEEIACIKEPANCVGETFVKTETAIRFRVQTAAAVVCPVLEHCLLRGQVQTPIVTIYRIYGACNWVLWFDASAASISEAAL